MKKITLTILFIFSLSLISCAKKEIIKTIFQSSNIRIADNQKDFTTIIDSIATITISKLDDSFLNSTDKTYIQLITKNNSENPLIIDKVFLEYDNKTFSNFYEKKKKIKYKRVLNNLFIFDEIVKLETIDYKLNYILPNDTVQHIVIFKRIPYKIRNFKLKVILKSHNLKKTIAFELRKFQYRIN